jgi:TetR/AcrR family fatty acid metabolism transcriptional regulator
MGRNPHESATRERLIQAAVDVFAAQGYHRATVDDIATASDASKGTFYYYFRSKQGIFLELLEQLAEMVESGVEAVIERETGALAKIEAALRVLLETASANQGLTRILLIESVALGAGLEQSRLSIHRRFAAFIQRHLDGAVSDGGIPPQDTRTAAMAWVGAINEAAIQQMAAGRDLKELLPPLRLLLLRSIGARTADETA